MERGGNQLYNPNVATPSFTRVFQPAPEPTPVRPLNLSRAQSLPAPNGPGETAAPLPPNTPRRPAQPHYYPINTWLADLNSTRRISGDTTDYTGILQDLLQENVQSTFEIIEMGREGLTGIGSIKRGTAIRLVAWAIEDRDRN